MNQDGASPPAGSSLDLDPLELGPDCLVEPGVILGYPTGRPIAQRRLAIGAGAKIRANTIVYGGSIIGSGLETGHGVVIREENLIGDDLSIWSHSVIDYGCRVGQRVRIHTGVYVCQFSVIGDDVFLAPHVTFTNDPHPICTKCMKGPTVGDRAKIGGGATLLPHVVIGQDAVVGAGAVVTQDVPPGAVVAGNPARVIGWAKDLLCQRGHKEKAYPHLS